MYFDIGNENLMHDDSFHLQRHLRMPLSQLLNVSAWNDSEGLPFRYYVSNVRQAESKFLRNELPTHRFSSVTGERETNIWISGPRGIHTQAHYDALHNIFLRLHGSRVLAVAPLAADTLSLYPHMHPRARKSRYAHAHALSTRIRLEPGDILYVPAYWFHSVTVVGEEDLSISANIFLGSAGAQSYEDLLAIPLPFESSWAENDLCTAMRQWIHLLLNLWKWDVRIFQKDLLGRFADHGSDAEPT